MKKETFFTTHLSTELEGESSTIGIGVEGERIKIENINCFIFYDKKLHKWNITHLETGISIVREKKKDYAMYKACEKVKRNDIEGLAKKMIVQYGIKYPVNQ